MDALRAIFSAGLASGLTAQEIFANRVEEQRAFWDAVARVAAWPQEAGGAGTADTSAPRNNVIVYHGLGGIGKTALSRELERRLHRGDFADSLPAPRAAARIDFGEAGAVDLETVMLRVRAGLAALRPSWPAFDVAFALYWARAHPGESLVDFVGRGRRLGQAAGEVGFGEQLQDAIVEICHEVGLAWAPARVGARLANLFYRKAQRGRTFRRLTSDCPFFADLAGADPTIDSLSYFPSLLAWELERAQRERPELATVFLDTFEAITHRETRELERLVQRLVFLMPNVLFVISGRNRLDWADSRAGVDLDYTGEQRWPLLAADNRSQEPRQHLMGGLSDSDCHDYLARVVSRADGTPAIGPDIRDTIVRGGAGLPLYLDLSVAQYLELVSENRAVTTDSFGGPLNSVVRRIMRDLPEAERDVLRGATLLDSFDAELVAASSPRSSDAVVARFLGRAFVESTVGQPWPYALHDLLRAAVRQADHELGDGWSPREWRHAAERLCARLGELALNARAGRDRVTAGVTLSQAVRLAAEFQLWPEWAVDVGQFLADAGAWQALDIRPPRADATASHTESSALAAGLRGIALRRTGSLEDSLASFDGALTSPELPGSARSLLMLHRIHSLRNSGRYDDAGRAYEALVRAGGQYADRARLQLADLRMLRGQFPDALAVLAALRATKDRDMLGEVLRVTGHVHRVNADFDAAELAYRRALDLGQRIESAGLVGKARTNLAETACWLSPADGLVLAEEAIEANDEVHNQLEVLKAYAAKAVACAGVESWDECERAVAEARRLVDATGYRAGGVFALTARAFHELLCGDLAGADATRREMAALTTDLRVYRFWCEVTGWWAAAAAAHDEADGVGDGGGGQDAGVAAWLGSLDSVRQRWSAVLITRAGRTAR